MDINRVYEYAVHALRPQNNEIDEPELNNIGAKCHDKNKFIICNDLRDTGCNQIKKLFKEPDPSIMRQLDNYTWMHYNPIPFLEDNNTT